MSKLTKMAVSPIGSAASGGGSGGSYADDFFSAYSYTGTRSSQTIANGINLSANGGMVWSKLRDSPIASGSSNFSIYDSTSNFTKFTETNSTATAFNASGSSAITPLTNGYSMSTDTAWSHINYELQRYISWTFRKAPKFFDIVTWTGDGQTDHTIPHNLGDVPGMVMIKALTGTGNWLVQHRSLQVPGQFMLLNTTAAAVNCSSPLAIGFDASNIYVHGAWPSAGANDPNASGVTYVAYIFGHDTSASGNIQCVYANDVGGVANPRVLGWEPQWVLRKRVDGVENWSITDVARGMGIPPAGGGQEIDPNTSAAEINAGGLAYITPTATGFVDGNTNGHPYIYVAIRRSNKPPSSGLQVYNAIARSFTTSTPFKITGVGFAPDMGISVIRQGGQTAAPSFADRLRSANKLLVSSSTAAETSFTTELLTFDQDGVTVGTGTTTASWNYTSTYSYIQYFFKRAATVFDVVCYTGDGNAGRLVTHGLGVVPELIITKYRSAVGDWNVYHSALGATKRLLLNDTRIPDTGVAYWNNTAPTTSTFTVGTAQNNTSGQTLVAYLFASRAGVSMVGSYVGNGASLTINCGFSNGARFIMIKRTDIPSDWYVWDTVRGIVAASDTHSSLNTTAAEVLADDTIDPDSSGFIVNQTSLNLNVASGNYIFLAMA